MNIAFFSESYKPYLSGVTNSIETLKNGLEELGHKTLVFSPNYPGAPAVPGVYRFPSIPATYPGYRITIPVPGMYFNKLKENQINLIHSHSPYQLGLLSMRYAKKLKIPFVFTMHTILSKYMHYVPLIPRKLSIKLMDQYIKWFSNRCNCVIVPTDKVAQIMHSIGIKTRIEIVPTGIDLNLAKKANPFGIRKKHGIPEDAKLLIFVGRLAKEKNIQFLLDSFKIIQEKEKHTFLIIAATGPLENELKRASPKNVVFAGRIPYPKVLDYYAASDIFIFSSLSETQALVLVEAMALGIPQVAVDAEGVSDIIKNGVTGYLTAPSRELFSAKIIELMKDELLHEKMSRSSGEIAKAIYSKEVFAHKIEQIYKSVI